MKKLIKASLFTIAELCVFMSFTYSKDTNKDEILQTAITFSLVILLLVVNYATFFNDKDKKL